MFRLSFRALVAAWPAAVFGALSLLASPARADTADQLRADIASDDFVHAQTLIAAHPDLGASALTELLNSAKHNIAANPAAAAKAAQLAANLAGDITSGSASEDASLLQAIAGAVSASANPDAATLEAYAAILAAAATLAATPDIVTAQPGLYGQIAALRTVYAADGNPASLQLAQQPSLQPPNPPNYRQKASGGSPAEKRMLFSGHRRARSAVAVLVVLSMAGPAQAYGPEGLFGGRPLPDYSFDFGNAAPASTDRPERAESVLSRPRPDYDPVPLMWGDFGFYPSLEAGGAYNSNIYATSGNTKDDVVGTLRPVLSGVSDWGRNSLSFIAYGDIDQYVDHTTESYQNAVGDVEGRYDIANQTWVSGHAGYQHLTEPRSSPNNAGGIEPDTFDVAKAGLSAYRGAGIVHAGVDYNFSHFTYDNVPTSTGTSIIESFRNRSENAFQTKITADAGGNVVPFLRLGYNRRDYDTSSLRTSQGYDAVIGSSVDFGGITSLEAYAGWLSQDYSNFPAGRINAAPDFGGRIDWNVTGLTSLALEVSRSVAETTAANFDSYLETGGSLTLTHELRRDLLVEADLSYSHDDFKGSGARSDEVPGAGAGMRWFINRNFYSDVTYNWSGRSSDNPGNNYADNIVALRLGMRM